MNEKDKAVIIVNDYDNVDGREAYKSENKALSLECEDGEIVAKIWKEIDGEMIATKLPLHQLLDLAILAGKGVEYFREAYRYPKLYNPENSTIDRVGVQGSAMTVEVCTENEDIDEQIKAFSQALNNSDELIGERIRVLMSVLAEME